MDENSWLPKSELRLIFRHVVVSIAVAAGVWLVSKAVVFFVPEAKEAADLIDQMVFLGILVILGVKLLWGLGRGGGMHAFAAA